MLLLLLGAGAVSALVAVLRWAPMTALSAHFTLEELTASAAARNAGLDNTPGPTERAALQALVDQVLEPWRARVGPLLVTSGYRGPALNAEVGGAAESQHTRGEAADVTPATRSTAQAWNALEGLPFDQAILYHPSRGGHIHVSHTTRRANRGERLYAPAGGGYEPWRPGDDHVV